MKATQAQLDKALAAPAGTRFFLLHGPDEAGSHALARALAAALGADAERVELSGTELRGDPARLSDEAASISMFGGPRYIVVDPAGDECLVAVEALAEAAAAGNPVVLIAGTLRPTSKLLKFALAHEQALAFASYLPDGRGAARLAIDLAREQGLAARPDVARRIAESAGGNRTLMALELQKFALFLDAAPDRPKPLDHEVIDALGAGGEEGDAGQLVDAVAGGDAATLRSELDRLAAEGSSGITLVRALLRRFLMIARLRAEIDRGKSVDAVMASQGKALFWKDKPALTAQLGHWRSDLLGKAIDRLAEAERQVRASGGIGDTAADEEMFAICRQAARLA